MSPQCCRCNGNGRCKGCLCARSGRICTNCTPSRNGRCKNLSHATASEVATQPPETLLSGRQATTTEERSSVYQADRQTTERTHGRESLSPNNHPPIVECASARHQQHNSSVSSSLSTSPNLDHAYDEPTFSTPAPNSISLPNFLPAPAANFRWDDRDGPSALQAIDSAYAEVVHWRCNTFMVPSGKAGKDYVREQARLLTAYADVTALEQIALKAAMLMPKLLLQKPHPKSKTKEHTRCLERRLHVWSAGNFEELIKEGKTIQQHLPQRRMKTSDQNQRLAKTFASLMLRGKVRAALRLLSENSSAGVLNLDQEIDGKPVRDILKEKHPPAQTACPTTLLSPFGDTTETHPVLFDTIDGELIRSTALRVQGSAGPSGMDAAGWRRICTGFHGASNDLCRAIAALSRRICTTFTDPMGLAALTACRLIPLSKDPGYGP